MTVVEIEVEWLDDMLLGNDADISGKWSIGRRRDPRRTNVKQDVKRFTASTDRAFHPSLGTHDVRRQERSTIRIGWAPSQRTRRPTSRRRSCQPASGSIVAKWFAASWPTFDAVMHAPYGKKISHSLIPPG